MWLIYSTALNASCAYDVFRIHVPWMATICSLQKLKKERLKLKKLLIYYNDLEVLFKNKETEGFAQYMIENCKRSKYGYNGDERPGFFYFYFIFSIFFLFFFRK